ncbi:MAG TPA: hypothetical protein VD860_16960 [Azospirillum sp.]|nr:hypothetical protein [Azospirillum sp.]
MLNVYATEHVHSATVCAAFAAGCGAPVVPPYPLLPGDVAMYGCLRGLRPTLIQAQREGRRWLYLDNGYFRPGHYDGYYRVTRDALQHDGSGTATPHRWERLGLSIAPWRAGGGHVVVCPPSDIFAGLMGFDARRWLANTLDTLLRHTDRDVRIREKTKKPGRPLAADLAGAWALVTHSSNAAVDALLAGVPVFCTNPCGAYRLGEPELKKIESPRRPDDREQWAWNLAANQWTLSEMADGTCWRMLNGDA